ncbi:MAG: ROK family protein [Acidimicrobiia bacterium]|nr:ROK family protein [Acidimicrobiia bacterium]
MELLGIDIGGSGIKGGMVDLETGLLTRDRHKIPTPQPATPKAVAGVVVKVVEHFEWEGPIGCTLPTVVRQGVVHSAANIDKSWIGVDGERLLRKATGQKVALLNDADAAGIAEMRFGAGRDRGGVVFILTFGTGIGSGVFVDGHLHPNTELGHLEFKGMDAEQYAAARVRELEKLTYKAWGTRVNEFLQHLENIFSPDLFVIGGGVSRKIGKFKAYLVLDTEVVPAQLRNEAGIVGAALTARDRL